MNVSVAGDETRLIFTDIFTERRLQRWLDYVCVFLTNSGLSTVAVGRIHSFKTFRKTNSFKYVEPAGGVTSLKRTFREHCGAGEGAKLTAVKPGQRDGEGVGGVPIHPAFLQLFDGRDGKGNKFTPATF